MKTINQQLLKLVRDGFTVPEAAEALGIDVAAASLALKSATEEKVNLAQLREDFLPRAFEILRDVAESAERDADKIKACQIIIQGEGILPQLEANQWNDRLNRMKQVLGDNIIDLNHEPLQLAEAIAS